MTLTTLPFRLNFGDFFAYYMRSYYKSALRPVSLVLQVLGMIALPYYLSRESIDHGSYTIFLMRVSVLCLTIYVLLPVLMAGLSWLKLKTTPSIQADRVVSLSEAGLQLDGEGISMALQWKRIIELVKTRRLILFVTGPQGAIIVPLTAFATPSDAEAFFTAARGYLKV